MRLLDNSKSPARLLTCIEICGLNGYMDKLKPCPFCGDEVEMKYDPVVAYSITCCGSMYLQICDALEDKGVRFDEGYSTKDDDYYGEYPEIAKDVCKEELTNMWNTRR